MFLPKSNITSLEYYVEDEENASFCEKLKCLENDDVCLVFTDILGGSVTREVAKVVDLKRVFVIAGFNLALILELMTTNQEEISKEHVQSIISEARNQMVLVNDLLIKEEVND